MRFGYPQKKLDLVWMSKINFKCWMNSNVHHSTNTMNLSAVCNLILSFEAPNFTKEKHWFRLQFYALQKYQLCYNSIIGLCLFLNGRLSEGRKLDILSLGISTFLPPGRCLIKQTKKLINHKVNQNYFYGSLCSVYYSSNDICHLIVYFHFTLGLDVGWGGKKRMEDKWNNHGRYNNIRYVI